MSTKLVEMNATQPTIIIEQNGQPTTVVMSYEYYQGLLNQLQKWQPPIRNDPLEQASSEFFANLSLDELTAQHHVRPVHDINDLLGPEPPEGEESADEFIADIRLGQQFELPVSV